MRQCWTASLKEIYRRSRLSFPAATTGMNMLLQLGVARELVGKEAQQALRL